VIADALKLTVYFGERDRVHGRRLSDVLLDACERRGLRAAVLLRAAEGFGIKHHLRSDRLLTLSEDLPLVVVAVDERARVEAALPEVVDLAGDGLVTLERARLLAGDLDAPAPATGAKLTLYGGRGDDPRALVEVLRRHGAAGATVLRGVDGTPHGERRRARLLGRDAGVPSLVVSVGDGAAIARALPDLARRLGRPLATLERVTVLDGGEPSAGPGWTKLSLYAGGGAAADAAVRRLREAGAAGATVLRGVWGYRGDRPPHGDRLLALRRDVPTVTVCVDAPERAARWAELLRPLAGPDALLTAEHVPAYRATGPHIRRGDLRLG
jgi:PII-like signaling protein